jgi:hypothetical protein
MMKAYDRVEWDYLEAILLKLGFNTSLVTLIMRCVTSVRFMVIFNGVLLPYFSPTRGLRQGDPMSPYLFLLCGEGFTWLLKLFGENYVDRGIRVSFWSPWVNHLMFADDSLIFISANDILRIYGDCSGQRVNRDKSAILFTPNTLDHLRISMKNTLGILVKTFSEKYLGLTTAMGRITSGTFDHIGERSRSKMQGWYEKHLA